MFCWMNIIDYIVQCNSVAELCLYPMSNDRCFVSVNIDFRVGC